MSKEKTTKKVITNIVMKQMWIFVVTLPNGDKYVDASTNKTPMEKLYYYKKKIDEGKQSAFLDAVRRQCNGRTDDLEIRILDYGKSNCNQLAAQWLNAKREEWIMRLETDNENKGGLNID